MIYLLLVAAAVLLLAATRFGPRLGPLFQRRRPVPPNPPVVPAAAGNAGAAGVPPAAPAQPAVQATTTTTQRSISAVRRVWRIIQWVVGILIAMMLVGLLIEYNYWSLTLALSILAAILLVPAWFGAKRLIKGAGGWIAVLIFLMVAAAVSWAAWDSIARGPAATLATIKNLAQRYEAMIAPNPATPTVVRMSTSESTRRVGVDPSAPTVEVYWVGSRHAFVCIRPEGDDIRRLNLLGSITMTTTVAIPDGRKFTIDQRVANVYLAQNRRIPVEVKLGSGC